MGAPRVDLVTRTVTGPHPQWVHPYMWTVDGPGGPRTGWADTADEAWADARAHSWDALGRIEVPGGGDQLRRAINGEGT